MPRGVRADDTRGVLPLLAAAAVLLSLSRGALAARGFFYSDDFGLRYRAATSSLDLQFVGQSYNGHVNPVGWLLAWLAQNAFPGSFYAVVCLTMLLWAGVLLLSGWLAVVLTLNRRVGILAMLVLSVSAFQWEVTFWWSAAIYALPYQLFALLCLSMVVKARTTSASWPRWLALVFYLAACLSFSRGLLVGFLVFVCGVALPWGAQPPMGLRTGWRWGRTMWIPMMGLAIASGLLVGNALGADERPRGTVGDVLHAASDLLLGNILPALWGGPVSWLPVALPDNWSPVIVVAAPGRVVVVVSLLLTCLTVALIWVRKPDLRLFLIGSACWVTGVALVAALARAGNPLASPAYRYTFDAVWPAVFLLAASIAVTLTGRRVGVVVLGTVLVVSSASAVVPIRLWGHNEGKSYVANAVRDFDSVTPEQTLLPQAVPPGLVDPLLLKPYANSRAVLLPERDSPDFGDSAQGDLLGFAPDGSLESQDVAGPGSVPGPDPSCGYAVTSNPRLIPLDGDLINWNWYVRVAYFTGQSTTLNVAFAGRITSVPLASGGLDAVYFPVTGPGRDVLVSVSDPSVTVCVTELRVGNRIGRDGLVVAAPPGGGSPDGQ